MQTNLTHLGVDFGRAKVGLAISSSTLAEPYKVLRYSSQEELLKNLEPILKIEKIEKIIVGISEGKMGKESKDFGKLLQARFGIPVEEFDETLSTHEAQEKSILGGISRKRRHEMEDAYAAAIMLQNYLDFHDYA